MSDQAVKPIGRRDFNQLFAAAVGGLMAGTLAGCDQKGAPAPQSQGTPQGGAAPQGSGSATTASGSGAKPGSGSSASGSAGKPEAVNTNLSAAEREMLKVSEDINPYLMAEEPHVCRGLNTCKGKDKTGKNQCAGQGLCATAEKHACNGNNECKGQGGCGEHPGQNTCKGKGACAVPLTTKTWAKARPQFELVMRAKGMKFGPAPAATK